jgi:hypothetical protein
MLAEMCPEFEPAESGADYFLASRAAYGRPALAYA